MMNDERRMTENFDKETDALLRQTAQSERASAAENPKSKIQNPKPLHLDADEISAFAENALPEKMKLLYTQHFADCDRCRKILSNVIALNSDAQPETAVHAAEIKIAAPIPWYRRIFAAPNLAYSMGALLLVFGGLIAFTFLKNAPQTTEISQTIEKPTGARGASSDGETVSTETAGAANASMSNAGSMQSNMSMTNSNSMRSNSAAMRDGFSSNAASMSNSAGISNSSSVAKDDAKNKSQTEPAATANVPSENQSRGSNFSDRKQMLEDEEVIRTRENDAASTDKSLVAAPKPAAPKTDAPSPPAKSSAASNRSATALSGGAQNKKSRSNEMEKAETRKVGDKTFRRDGGVWYDAAYNGQSTTNVARGTKEFGRLDSGLRSIAENLSGTIVVVWKSKTYRIQ